MKDSRITGDNAVCLVTKIVAEPVNLTYRGPSTRRGGGIFGGLTTRIGKSEVEGTLETVSHEVQRIDLVGQTEADANALQSVTISDNLLTHWKDLVSDSELEAQVENFHKQLNALLAQKQKKEVLSTSDVQAVVTAMRPYNVGVVYKIHLVVSRVQGTEFPKAGLGNDGKYHRTVQSRVAYRRLTDFNVEPIIDQLNDVYTKAWKSSMLEEASETATNRQFTVVDVTDHRGRSHKAIRTIRSDGTISSDILN